MSTHDNDEYGIFPSHVGQGRVDHSFASGSNDTGHLHRPVARRADRPQHRDRQRERLRDREQHERGRAATTSRYGNTGGILSFTLPGLDVRSNHDNEIANNNVHDNNKPNTCVDPDDTVCAVPPGTGILILAADTNNDPRQQRDRATTRSGSRSRTSARATQRPATRRRLDIDLFPDGNHIVSNTVTGNGTNPDPNVPSIFAVDLAWDFTGTGNCWSDNTAGTAFPSPLPRCP